jgi:hypothetical protein
MTNNIRERIKQRSEDTYQKGGLKIPKTNKKKKEELEQGVKLAWNVTKIYFQQLLEYIHLKLRPLFNTYLNWGDVFEQDSLSGESTKRIEIQKDIFEFEQDLKKLEEINQSAMNETEINKYKQQLKDKKEELESKRKELSNIKNIQYISIWAYFVAFFKSFTEKTEDDLTPQEKIMKKRGNKYGTMPKPSFGIIKTLIKPVIVIALIVVSILSNFMIQKKYIIQLIDQKTDICNAIFQSKVYTEDTHVWNRMYHYFNNKNNKNKQEALLMRDYYTGCSYKTYLGCGYETVPTRANIKPIIKSGARVLHFDVFEDVISTENTIHEKDKIISEEYVHEEGYSGTETTAKYVPMVRCATNNVSIGISFNDIVEEIKNSDPFGDGLGGPFIIYLDMWYQDSDILSKPKVYEGFRYSSTYDMIYDVIDYHFGKSSGNRIIVPNISGYGWGGTSTTNASLCNIPMHLVQDKLLLISNINPQGNYAGASSSTLTNNSESTSSLSPYLYATVSYPTIAGNKFNGIEILNRSKRVSVEGNAKDPGMEGFIYDENLYNMSGLKGKIGSGLQDLKKYVQTSIMIAIPGVNKPDGKLIWKNSLQNPNFLDCFQYGIQFVFMNYQECLKETNNYIQFFVNHKQQFIVKREDLRYTTYVNPTIDIQNKALSYETVKGATIGNGPNPFFRSIY